MRNVVTNATKPTAIDSVALAAELRTQIRGEVRFDEGSRALYATDASNYRQVPIGVVIPKDVDDVIKIVATCYRYGAPILARGGGTSLAGQCCNVAVVIDMSKYMHQIIEIDPQKRLARVQPGTILDDLRHVAEQFHLTFGPDPATHSYCTLGGMIGNNSCGTHSVMAGKTVDNIETLEILTYDGVRMRAGKTTDDELERIINEGGRRGEIYSKLKALRNKYVNLIRERYPPIPRRVSGYNLDQLLPENDFHVARALVGTENTCVTVLEATAHLVASPPARSLLVLGYPDIYRASDHVMELLAHKPIALEGMDDRLIEGAKRKGLFSSDTALLPSGGGWLLVEFGSETDQESIEQARGLMEELKRQQTPPDMRLFENRKEAGKIWSIREAAVGATGRVPGEKDAWPGWEDSAVPPDKVGDYLRELRKLLECYDYRWAFYGHFGHGCIHTRISFDLETSDGIAAFRSFMGEAADLVIKYGGSLSGEHGDGQARAELLPKMFGDELIEAFREFKAIWDPDGKMNPGKVVDAYRIDENLRLGTNYQGGGRTEASSRTLSGGQVSYTPLRPKTYFSFVEDQGSLAKATLRCIGVGQCRKLAGGTMCPSFMVTREEQHSTRGRAHLLFEMLQGNPLEGGWRSESVKEALDLCLACKGCKSDCPANVDMATYKAEFLSHYYQRRLRPVTGYMLGLIHRWARFAALAPGVVNFFTQTPLLRDVAKILAGIAPERQIPAFAPKTFQQWFRKRGILSGVERSGTFAPSLPGARRTARGAVEALAPGHPGDGQQGQRWQVTSNEGQPKVILWPDTFNNHFHPETAIAAVEVLEAAGYQVEVPLQALCCGRPLYDYGMLNTAKRLLRNILDTLRPQIEQGVPVVGLEPSCVAVFRDELIDLFPEDEVARRLKRQTFLLSEFLVKGAEHYQFPQLHRKAVVHGHCHHEAIMKMKDEEAVLAKLGLDYTVLDSGCCGMAGAFGFEKDHYDVSIKVGERVLLPIVRSADKDTMIIADGFSCREQIAQTTGRHALHLAQVIQMAMHEDQSRRSLL